MFDGFSPRLWGADYLARLRRRSLVRAANQSSDAHGLKTTTVKALERIATRSGPLLRLPADVEPHYRREWRTTANYVRVILCMLPVVVFGTLPALGAHLLRMPAEMAELVRIVYLGAIIPTALVASVIAWTLPQSRIAGVGLLAAGLIMVLTLEYLSAEGARHGYDFDHAIAVCVPVALSVLGGFRFGYVLGLIAGYCALVLLAVPLLDAPSRSPTMWLGEGVLLFLSAFTALWMETTQRRGWAARRLLQLQAHQDPMTGLRNRRSFEQHFDVVAAQARRDNKLLFFALADLDHFKRINDRYGHEYGDGALSEVGVVMSQFGRRPLDAVARLGGEEFAILLYDCEPGSALARLQELVDQVRALGIDNADAPLHVLTISAGGVISDGSLPMSELYHSADSHLYAVKHRGRNGARVGPILAG